LVIITRLVEWKEVMSDRLDAIKCKDLHLCCSCTSDRTFDFDEADREWLISEVERLRAVLRNLLAKLDPELDRSAACCDLCRAILAAAKVANEVLEEES